MRRTLAVLAVVVLGALASVTAAQAGNTTITNTTFHIDFFTFVPCAAGGAGEVVEVSGDIHVLTRVTINGNHVSFTEHDNFQGITGTGLTTGDTYQGGGANTFSSNDNLNNPQLEETVAGSFHLNGHGSAPNLTIREVGHLTINANGETTVFFDNFSVDCG